MEPTSKEHVFLSNPAQTLDKPLMVVADGVLKVSDLPKVYENFRKDISAEGLQVSYSDQTRKGYDTLGYGYAWITERLNDVVGPQCWRIVTSDETVDETASKSGNTMYEVAVDVTLQLGNWKQVTRKITRTIKEELAPAQEDGMSNKDQCTVVEYEETFKQFEVLAEFVGFGWHKAMAKVDGRKGAYTNGLKKAAAFFGIGNDAYKKNIDEENAVVKEKLTRGRNKAPEVPQGETTTPVASENFARLNSILEGFGCKTDEEKLAFADSRLQFNAKDWKTLSLKQINFLLVKVRNLPKA